MIDLDRIRKLAERLRDTENGVQTADALDAILADNEQLRAALTQIKTVCTDNAAETVRHDLALIFVGAIARAALSGERPT